MPLPTLRRARRRAARPACRRSSRFRRDGRRGRGTAAATASPAPGGRAHVAAEERSRLSTSPASRGRRSPYRCDSRSAARGGRAGADRRAQVVESGVERRAEFPIRQIHALQRREFRRQAAPAPATPGRACGAMGMAGFVEHPVGLHRVAGPQDDHAPGGIELSVELRLPIRTGRECSGPTRPSTRGLPSAEASCRAPVALRVLVAEEDVAQGATPSQRRCSFARPASVLRIRDTIDCSR